MKLNIFLVFFPGDIMFLNSPLQYENKDIEITQQKHTPKKLQH
jgi:hypothetical protein